MNQQEPFAAIPGFTMRWGDFFLMLVMVSFYLTIALYDLGSFKVPATVWQPKKSGEAVILDLGRKAAVDRIYYYSGINENCYGDAKFCLQYENGGVYRPFLVIDKKECGIWKYQKVNVATSRIKIVADPPGGALNEIAVVAKGEQTPLEGIAIIKTEGTTNEISGRHLLDEQDTFEYVPTFRSGFYFDEIYHARTAYEYLHHMEPYENTHPPLGKVFIAAGIALFGMNSFGWRIVGTLFGAAMLPLMYMFGLRLFGNRFAAFTASFLLMADFMHFTQTRIATIDVYATFFIMLMYFLLTDFYLQPEKRLMGKKPLRSFALSGFCFGLGAASKWITLYAGVGAGLLIAGKMFRLWQVEREENPEMKWHDSGCIPLFGRYLLFFLVVPLCIYVLSYIPFLMVKGPGHQLFDIVKNQRDMYAYHSTLHATHPFSSPWWSWPLDLKPVWFYVADLPYHKASTIAGFGNPLIWWCGIPAVLIATVLAFRRHDRGMAVVLTAITCQYLPWVLIPRLAFIYHYFSVVPFMIMAQVSVMQAAVQKWSGARYVICTYLFLAAILFIIYYPVLSGMPLARERIESLRWLKSWEF